MPSKICGSGVKRLTADPSGKSAKDDHDPHLFEVVVPALLPQQTEWRDWASCREVDPELWFAEKGHQDWTQAAKRICGDCPVKDECLQFALDHDLRFGVYGGTSERERRPMHKAANAARRRAA
jgi:hypothetical protein